MEYKHLEISGRVSGKTDRLLNQFTADRKSDPRGYRYLILTGYKYTGDINRKLYEDYNITTHNMPTLIIENMDNYDRLRGRSFNRIYLDEFDQIGKELYQYFSVWFNHVNSWYACGSPRYVRNEEELHRGQQDIFQFLKSADYQYVTYFNNKFVQRNPQVSDAEKYGLFLN